MKIKYSFLTRKLRVYWPDGQLEGWIGIGLVKLADKAWFVWLTEDLEERLKLLRADPKSPYQVQEISYLLRRAKKFSPVLVCDLPGWKNPRFEGCRAEWLRALRQVDKKLAQKVRQFIVGAGKLEYLR